MKRRHVAAAVLVVPLLVVVIGLFVVLAMPDWLDRMLARQVGNQITGELSFDLSTRVLGAAPTLEAIDVHWRPANGAPGRIDADLSFHDQGGDSLMCVALILDLERIYDRPVDFELAMNVPLELAIGSVRLTLAPEVTAEQVDYVIRELPAIVRRLMRVLPGVPVMAKTPRTLPTRSTTATVAGRPRACASPTACAMICWTSPTDSARCAGSVNSRPPVVGVGLGVGDAVPPPPPPVDPPSPPQDARTKARAPVRQPSARRRIIAGSRSRMSRWPARCGMRRDDRSPARPLRHKRG